MMLNLKQERVSCFCRNFQGFEDDASEQRCPGNIRENDHNNHNENDSLIDAGMTNPAADMKTFRAVIFFTNQT